MTRFIAVLSYQFVLHFRHGFYYAYTVLTALYIVMLNLIEPSARAPIAALIVFTDPSVLGFAFIGGLILMEKDENTLQNLFVTPIRVWEYIAAKDLSLSALALVTSSLIAVTSVGLGFNWALFLTGILLTSTVFIQIGIVAVSRVKSVNAYFLTAVVYLTLFFVPALDYYGVLTSYVFWAFPTWASITLIGGAFDPSKIEPLRIAAAYAVMAVWNIGTFLWARKRVEDGIVHVQGEKK
ncbi:MAG: hypothetical protein A2Y33_09300 [Spirochaetes bacterium GWF1_51_8]|nr:MAG: hypothetical protein A2Y33_09300 [Spirochaetes bacterium GWF1_51_8]